MSFDDVYQEYFEQVYRFFRRKGLMAQDAADLTQDVFVRVFRHWEGFRGDASARTWVFRIAHNTHINWIRDREAQKQPKARDRVDLVDFLTKEGDIPALYEVSALSELLEEERRDLLWQEVGKLPAGMRRCLVLYLDGHRYSEVSILLGISADTVKSHLFQAKQRLRKTLG